MLSRGVTFAKERGGMGVEKGSARIPADFGDSLLACFTGVEVLTGPPLYPECMDDTGEPTPPI